MKIKDMKFRGVATGERYPKGKVYTSYLDYNGSRGEYWITFEDARGTNRVPVDQDSLSALIGVDKNGREVYTGDKLVDDFDNTLTADFVVIHIERMTLLEAAS